MKELTKLFTIAVGVTLLSTLLLQKVYAAPLPIEQDEQYKVIGVRLSDFSRYAKTKVPRLKEVVRLIKKNPSHFFKNSIVQVHGVFFRAFPDLTGNQVTLHIDAMIATNEYTKSRKNIEWLWNIDLSKAEKEEKTLRFRDIVFERITVKYNANPSGPLNLKINLFEVINLKDTEFEVNVGMIERKIVLTDKKSDLRFTYPTGLGGIDNRTEFNDVRLLTPIYKNAFLDKKRAIFERFKPSYFEGKPFIRITTNVNPDKGHTPIGFHIDQNNGALKRGFVSNGCLRMRGIDLFMLYDIVRFGTPQRISVNTRYKLEDDQAGHPYPMRNSGYTQLKKYKLKKGLYYRRCRFCKGKLMKTEWSNSPRLKTIIEQLIDTNEFGERPDGSYLWRRDAKGVRRDIRGQRVDKYGFPLNKKGRRFKAEES